MNRPYRIVKVANPNIQKPTHVEKRFPRMPRMYLELLENKAKIKQDLINKEYVPSAAILQGENQRKEEESFKNREGTERVERPEKVDKHETPGSLYENQKGKGSKNSAKEDAEDEESSSQSSKSTNSTNSSKSTESSDSRSSETSSSSSSRKTKSDISDRLKELLEDTAESVKEKYDKSPSTVIEKSVHSRYTPYDKYKETVEPPTLKELEAKGQYQRPNVLRDITHVPLSEVEEEDKKRELLFKFDILRKSYPHAKDIPEHTIHTAYTDMQKSYDTTVRFLSLDASVSSYKNYLLYGFMAVEYIFGSILKFEIAGFTQHQMVNMHNYEKLLVELGERSYVPTGSRWPVELRLLGMIILNAAVFVLGKMIIKHSGQNFFGLMQQANSPPAPQTENRPKRKMRGPSIDPESIPDLSQPASGA